MAKHFVKQALFCTRVDADAKKGFEAVCDEIGLAPAEAINMYMRFVAREECLPFEVSIGREHGRMKMNPESAAMPAIPNILPAARGAFDMEALVSLMRAKRQRRNV